MRYAQLVVGPAGSGKSTYCSTIVKHASDSKRIVEVVNLDPAAEHFDYEPLVDIRELIHLDDAMEDEELQFGPNGGLVFCIETLLENCDWLEEQLGDVDDDYLLFDCPGQIELYTHLPVMRKLVDLLQKWNFRICVVFMVDSQFMIDGAKFLSGTMAALSVMVNLELPHLPRPRPTRVARRHEKRKIKMAREVCEVNRSYRRSCGKLQPGPFLPAEHKG
ncbi:hypothetical protein HF086_001997 [Spodoptera exigua]|uniref:GPN-loop GTPase 3 n=1 Tax=Spodoptera exigua TaxID=7107 RepID=A0A922MLA8_SPOEX|nr:hypothetical protein HF086_001997 [Spodoptera exigua]